MAKKERSTLKSYFRTGNIPNQSQYEDLIDSNLNLSDTEEQTILGDLVIQGAVDINNTLEVNSIDTGFGAFEVGQDTRTTDSVTFSGIFSSGSKGNITASGAISASGDIHGNNLRLNGDVSNAKILINDLDVLRNITSTVGVGNQNNLLLLSGTSIDIGSLTTEIGLIGPVTASSPISSSGTIIANSGSFASQVNAATGSFTQLVVGDQTSGTGDLILKKFGTIKFEDFAGNQTDVFLSNVQDSLVAIGNFAASTQITGEGISLIASASGDGSFASDKTISLTATGEIAIQSNLDINAPTTASFPVSCSAKITADTLQINGSEVDFTNLPTSDPGVSGRLYNDSGTVKISAG